MLAKLIRLMFGYFLRVRVISLFVVTFLLLTAMVQISLFRLLRTTLLPQGRIKEEQENFETRVVNLYFILFAGTSEGSGMLCFILRFHNDGNLSPNSFWP